MMISRRTNTIGIATVEIQDVMFVSWKRKIEKKERKNREQNGVEARSKFWQGYLHVEHVFTEASIFWSASGL